MSSSAVVYNNVPTAPCIQTPLSVATPDGGLLYTGLRCVNYISAPSEDGQEAPEVKTMSTRIAILGLDVNPMWGKPDHNDSQSDGKYFAIVAEDSSVQVWSCALGGAVSGHKAHQHQHEARDVGISSIPKAVLMSYMSNGNILSIDAHDLVIYCVASNSFCRRPTFIAARNHHITVLRCSPYNDNLFALGTAAGAIMVCDLRKMAIVYKLGGHKTTICSLAWREMPLSKISSDNEQEQHSELIARAEQWRQRSEPKPEPAKEKPIKEKEKLKLKSKPLPDDDPFDIYNYDHLEDEFGAPSKLVRPRLSSKSSDDAAADFVGIEKPSNGAGQSIDFVEACESMKAELASRNDEDGNEGASKLEVTLADCKQAAIDGSVNDGSCSSDTEKQEQPISDSTEGSLEVLQYSSSDDAVIVDGDAPKPKREVLHHIYHQAEVHAQTETPQPKEVAVQANIKAASSLETLSSRSDASALRPDVLLVSIDVDEVIMIWNTLTGLHVGKTYGKSQLTCKLTAVSWLSDKMLVSNSRNQLWFWSVEADPKQQRYKIFKDRSHCCPMNDIITFAACPLTQHIWLGSRERIVSRLNPLTAQLSNLYGCLSFGVRAIAECPEDMNKIALGCGDRRVALFDVSKLSARCIPIDSTHVNAAVYSLAWSPDSKQLAYATYDGTVGIIDVDRMKISRTFRAMHKSEIYSLVWQDHYIYFICNRELGIYDVNSSRKDATLLKSIKRASYLSLRGAFLFVGSGEGYLELYERKPGSELNFISLRQQPLTARYITDIGWNPLIENQFAVVGHDKFVFVLEFLEEERNWKLLHSFASGHKKSSITSLKWSHSQAHLLLTFHIEGKVCMWNTKEPQQPPLTITFPCPMWCGMFLPTDENIIMCSGKSASLEFINIKEALAADSKQICSKSDALLNVKWASKSLTPPYAALAVLSAAEKKRQKTTERREQRKLKATQAENEADVEPESEPVEQPAEPVKDELPIETMLDALSLDTNSNAIAERNNGKESEESSKQSLEEPPSSFLAHSRTCLYLTQKELNKSALEKLAVVLTEDAANIEKSVLTAKLFSTKVVAKELLSAELQNLQHSDSKGIAPLWLSMANFKLRDELERHLNNKTLTEWHLSVAPAVSYNFWTLCCKAYASQLQQQGYVLHAATYLMAIHVPGEAVEMLLEHEFYKEALLVARVYLPATDEIIKDIINQWLEQLEKVGNLAAAALICVLDNEMLRGLSYLRKLRNCTPEIQGLMRQIQRNGHLGPQLEPLEKIEMAEEAPLEAKESI